MKPDRLFIENLQAQFPLLSVKRELWKIHAWLAANPVKRPLPRNFERFAADWLARQACPKTGRNGPSDERKGIIPNKQSPGAIDEREALAGRLLMSGRYGEEARAMAIRYFSRAGAFSMAALGGAA